MTAEELEELGAILGHRFAHPERLEQALTHRSRRQNDAALDNERLEFLGDRVLGLIASEMLCQAFPDWDAGKLSKGLARLVSAVSLHSAAERLRLGDYLRLGPGEEKTGGRAKKRLLSDAYEAVLGAICHAAGLKVARQFLRHTLLDGPLGGELGGLDRADHKSALQEWLQQRGLGAVQYRVRNEFGPEHQKTFEVEVWLAQQKLAHSEGRSKKEAEQAAAKIALAGLESNAAST